MYIFDFLKNLFRKANIGLIVYLLLNVTLLFLIFGNENFVALLVVLAFYLISLATALSPIGENLLRKQTGSREIQNESLKKRIDILFNRVYQRASEKDPKLPNDIKIFVNDDKMPNAFAVGRKTICVTEGLIDLPDNEIEAILAHEFAHLSHKDTDILLIITVGNLLVMGFLVLDRWLSNLFRISSKKHKNRSKNNDIIGDFLMWVWIWIGLVLTRYSSRKNEFEADHFASEIGYGRDLANALERLSGTEPQSRLLRSLYASHPKSQERICKLRDSKIEYASV